MKGRDIALATLHREPVARPCINSCWMTNTTYMSRLAGRDYWSDREAVFLEYLLRHLRRIIIAGGPVRCIDILKMLAFTCVHRFASRLFD